ncbi:MAG: F0F1 ATP synthase subunit delta [Candidatus Symbiothrix sp.]|jgi:F-type H+-transporting ATPase subunit delta|nr:F0F1 ATP synthase subunit delta [Candidatus Symbiothrix sp.]
MNVGIISTRYAKAFYQFAADRSDETRLNEEMKTLSRQFAAMPELNKVLENPIVSSEEKVKLLTAAIGETISETCRNIFRVIIENGRASYMQHIALVYDQVYRKEKNIVLVKLTTVAPATEEEKKSMVKLISDGKTTHVDFAAKTDTDIIGGFILEVEDLRLDASVRNQLNTMKLELTNGNFRKESN